MVESCPEGRANSAVGGGAGDGSAVELGESRAPGEGGGSRGCATPGKALWKHQPHRAFQLRGTPTSPTAPTERSGHSPAPFLHPLPCCNTPEPFWHLCETDPRGGALTTTHTVSCQHRSASRVPAKPSAWRGQFTFLTLPGVCGVRTRRLMGVRGVLPYIISASIWRLFFRCCVRELRSPPRAEEQRGAGCSAKLWVTAQCQRKGRLPMVGSSPAARSRYFGGDLKVARAKPESWCS